MNFILISGSGIALKNNEIKDNIKVIRGTLLKETTKNITSQEKGFLSFSGQ